MLHPPTAYSRSFSGGLAAELEEMNPYKYGINFPPQIWQFGGEVLFIVLSVMLYPGD